MGQDGIPMSIAVLLAVVILGVMITMGMIIMAIFQASGT
jgi:Flp pilus assembly pilin Flp